MIACSIDWRLNWC